MKKKILILCCVLFPVFFVSCGKAKPSIYKKTKPLMDTLVTITVVSASEEEADKAIEKAFSVIGQFGNKINFFSDKSELSAINKNAGIAPVKVSDETMGVIERALFISEKSGGAFDPTIGPEIRLWDFYKKVRPEDAAIKKNLSLVNFRDIILDHSKSTVLLKRNGMMLDLGGIAKGYAADLALASLRQDKIAAGIVAAAGDIRAFGLKPDGTLWNIGIKNPRQKSEADELIARARLTNKAISTSGDYERYFMDNGRRFHHILDPKTGYPASQCRSVTVISDSGIFADGFSTAVFVSGPEKGMELVRQAGVDAVIIDKDGGIHTTPGIKGMVTFEDSH
ncbi:ApbE-like protein lipoprotein [Candidatus Sulfobium mesophilum]|uniref:FAD:protein FMN transferase n=1 Tax=Candidatus Sulfobium mesophilum TaxID=2016548 RepID=A0A2U3QG94_9BACT|nr:ApbE-like protein lipoprotein [Candidatus Sulfobium mesophilum]